MKYSVKLPHTLKAFQNSDFKHIFRDEIASLKHHLLPLQQGLSYSSYVSDESVSVILINTTEDKISIQIKASIFYTGIIAGCSCADDPTPIDTQQEHCELLFIINKQTAETDVILISE